MSYEENRELNELESELKESASNQVFEPSKNLKQSLFTALEAEQTLKQKKPNREWVKLIYAASILVLMTGLFIKNSLSLQEKVPEDESFSIIEMIASMEQEGGMMASIGKMFSGEDDEVMFMAEMNNVRDDLETIRSSLFEGMMPELKDSNP